MFAIRVKYLMGRVYSAVFDDGDSKVEAEWPPHPSRLFSALVSAWGDGGAEEELKAALEWIESQEAPTIHAGDCTPRKLVQAFVPVNDKVSLPEDRARKPRTFPSATLTQPDVYFVWKDSPPSNIASALKTILDRTSSIGHSASLVAAEITKNIPEAAGSIWQPDTAGEMRMRIAYPGRLKELTARAIAGTYTVNSNCTGTFALQVTFPASSGVGTIPVPVFFVIDNNGTEFQAIETSTGDVITRIGRALFPGRTI